MNQRTWPYRSDGSRFSALPPPSINGREDAERARKHRSSPSGELPSRSSPPSSSTDGHDFSALPYDVLTKIAASFARRTCGQRRWCAGRGARRCGPLREAMLLLRWGKTFKHGRGGVRVNLEKALESFLKGASRGSTLAMVDAGLLYWETGRKEKAIALYRKAASLGDSSGQFNLGVSYLQAEAPNPKEAVSWLYKSAMAGHVRAQYQLALCLHHGHGVDNDIQQAKQARWYMKAAEGGYVRAMYNVALCYSFGEGLARSHRQGRKWMKRAADHGHTKAQVEHGLALFSEGEMLKALVYLELASRGGETRGSQVKNVILQKLSATSRDRALHLVDSWRAFAFIFPSCIIVSVHGRYYHNLCSLAAFVPPLLSSYCGFGCFI